MLYYASMVLLFIFLPWWFIWLVLVFAKFFSKTFEKISSLCHLKQFLIIRSLNEACIWQVVSLSHIIDIIYHVIKELRCENRFQHVLNGLITDQKTCQFILNNNIAVKYKTHIEDISLWGKYFIVYNLNAIDDAINKNIEDLFPGFWKTHEYNVLQCLDFGT